MTRTVEQIRQELAALQEQRDEISRQIKALAIELWAAEAVVYRHDYGLSVGDKLLMTAEAQAIIGFNNGDKSYIRELSAVGVVFSMQRIVGDTVVIRPQRRPVCVGGIPIPVAQKMRIAYLESGDE